MDRNCYPSIKGNIFLRIFYFIIFHLGTDNKRKWLQQLKNNPAGFAGFESWVYI